MNIDTPTFWVQSTWIMGANYPYSGLLVKLALWVQWHPACTPQKKDYLVYSRNTGDSRYVDFTYLDTITYVEVIFHSQHFFPIYLCISTPSMLKTVNVKQRVSRGDFSCPRRIFYYICYWVCRSENSTLARAMYCLLRLCICINWGAKIFQTMVKNNWSDITSFDRAINFLFSTIKSIHLFDTKSHSILIKRNNIDNQLFTFNWPAVITLIVNTIRCAWLNPTGT